jgi:rubrerythrin
VDDSIFPAARVILPFLGQLVEPATAADLRTRIEELLDQAEKGQDTSAELRAALDGNEVTWEFTLRVMSDAPHFRPPREQEHRLRVVDLPGQPQHISTPKYVCPNCGKVWYRPDRSYVVPVCAIDHVRLVEAAQGAGT